MENVNIDEEVYTHEWLWRSSSRLLEHAEANTDNSFYFLLPSLLTSFMAYEAFVNFCGFVILPELWAEEKKHFKGKGLEGKVGKIISKLPGFVWRRGEAPYQRITNIEDFRDIVAHGKVVTTQYVTEKQEDGRHFQFKHPWDTYLSIPEVKITRADMKTFCQSLLVELRKHADHPHINFDAFEGPFASGRGVSKHD